MPRNPRRLIGAAVASLLGILMFAGNALAGGHPVSPKATVGCTANAGLSPYCGSETLTALNLDLAVTNHPVVYSALTFKTHGVTNASEDFYVFAYSGVYGIEWAPNGNTSNLCVAEANNGTGVVLKTCAKTTQQQWTATGGWANPHRWRSQVNGLVITDPASGGQYTRASMAIDVSADGQVFTFIRS